MIASIATGELGFPDNSRVMQGPWWAWLGGLCGAVSLLSQPIAAPRLAEAGFEPSRFPDLANEGLRS